MQKTRTAVRDRAWLVAIALGVAGSVLVLLVFPQGREVTSGWQYVVKLAMFSCVVAAVALFPNRRANAYLLLFAAFLVFAGYLFPRISYFYYGDVGRVQDDSSYTHLYLLAYPALVLTVTAAYRLGGGTSGHCIKIAGVGVIILSSGFLDVMWQLVNPVVIPATIDAPHIRVLTGGPISFNATILFVLAYLPLAVALVLLPLDRWIDRLLGPETGPAPDPSRPDPARPDPARPDEPVTNPSRTDTAQSDMAVSNEPRSDTARTDTA